MNDHVIQWLEAYHDNELKDHRTRQVELHLEECETCRNELKEIQALSSFLVEWPNPSPLTPPETFVTQVGLQLPRKPRQTNWQRAYQTVWRLTPFGILAVWTFLQAAILVTGLITVAMRIVPGGDQIASLLPSQPDVSITNALSSSELNPLEIGRLSLEFMGAGSPLGWFPTLSMGLTIIVGLLYLSWLASWWVQQSNGNNHQSIHAKQMERS